MRLPDSFLDELRNRLSLSQVVGRKVVWDLRKSNQAKGDWWAPCPFHQEKTASFHVDDQKGFYYCFGCQAKGNLFGFVMETENVSFMEAVELLAREAGMQMPARDPEAAVKSDRRSRLAELCEEATKWFRLQLSTRAGSEARTYLDGRGLQKQTIDRFEIGFAPGEREGLRRHLMDKGAPPEMIEAAGLATPAEDGDVRDRFLNRITFPIRDGRGRCIGFGGRAMNPNAKAKYLNSPETELFDKGANLYNLREARAAAGKGAPLLVAEGYMDVIALAQAGFEAAVAPLGTAVTERQLQLLWRVAPEPIVALDGDEAGQRAGLRVADLALPLIKAGQSLRFAILPQGQDPDDLIRAKGRDAMQAVIEGASPMISLLWQRETDGRQLDSPERRAAFDDDLRRLIRRINDPGLRRHYGDEFARLRADLLPPPVRAPRNGKGGTSRWQPPAQAMSGTRNSALASGLSPDAVLEQVALAGLVHHPRLIESFADDLERMQWSREDHSALADALLSFDPELETRDDLGARLGGDTLEAFLGLAHLRIVPATRPGADDETAAACIRDALNRLETRRGAEREREEAAEDLEAGGDEALTWRVTQAARRRDAAIRAPREETGSAAEEAAEMSKRLQDLLDTRVWEKTKRK
ncbi:DNA primase [Jannaschia aquimarina]|uniref:DNA primase n=1 Tax=Jannaschia aquimarina TaxID=935700 RepID=A0A0D1EFT2_9RHOB|nr:DNA primase [Jannaschia aquimarina]KIT16549.1 DNA primase [Jannaschia aquimarina]SNT05935.1 DNA primase [Jannaschia aquimarina]